MGINVVDTVNVVYIEVGEVAGLVGQEVVAGNESARIIIGGTTSIAIVMISALYLAVARARAVYSYRNLSIDCVAYKECRNNKK